MYQLSSTPRGLHTLLAANLALITSTLNTLSTLHNQLTLRQHSTPTHLHSCNLTLSELKLARTRITSTISHISSSLSDLKADLELAIRRGLGEEEWDKVAGPNGNALLGEEGEGIHEPLQVQRVDMQIPGMYRLKNLQAQVNVQKASVEVVEKWLEVVEGNLVKLTIYEGR